MRAGRGRIGVSISFLFKPHNPSNPIPKRKSWAPFRIPVVNTITSDKSSVLALLGTHPKHERRGAAAMLIRWGLAEADKSQKKCYVDSSSVGYALYKRCGFATDVSEVVVDLEEYGGKGMGTHKWVAMLREPQPVTEN